MTLTSSKPLPRRSGGGGEAYPHAKPPRRTTHVAPLLCGVIAFVAMSTVISAQLDKPILRRGELTLVACTRGGLNCASSAGESGVTMASRRDAAMGRIRSHNRCVLSVSGKRNACANASSVGESPTIPRRRLELHDNATFDTELPVPPLQDVDLRNPVRPVPTPRKQGPFPSNFTFLDAMKTVRVTPIAKPNATPLQGPLCVFVPANGHDAAHLSEVAAFMEAWADASTVLYSENTTMLQLVSPLAAHRGVTLVQANHTTWNRYHADAILSKHILTNRGATPEYIRGRGQLSIPLFHWIAELVKRDDPLVQNCKWFMKCDTDTYLRRGLLEREVLNHLDHRKPYHVGVPLPFNTQPYHHTARDIRFEYNIGGPGYTFSRGLMAGVDTKACLASMALDPVLLIHDDVGAGFCATYYASRSRLVRIHTAVASSASGVVSRLLSFDVLAKAIDTVPTTTTTTSTLGAASVAVAAAPSSSCALRFTSAHPVNATLMLALGALDRFIAASTHHSSSTATSPSCEATLVIDVNPVVGRGWSPELSLDSDLADVAVYWKGFWHEGARQALESDGHAKDFAKARRFQRSLFGFRD